MSSTFSGTSDGRRSGISTAWAYQGRLLRKGMGGRCGSFNEWNMHVLLSLSGRQRKKKRKRSAAKAPPLMLCASSSTPPRIRGRLVGNAAFGSRAFPFTPRGGGAHLTVCGISQLLRHLVGEVRVRVHLGNVVVGFHHFDELHQLFRRLDGRDIEALLRDVLESRTLDRVAGLLQDIARLGPMRRIRRHRDESIFLVDVPSSRIDELQFEVLGKDACFAAGDDAEPIEHPAHGIALRPATAPLLDDGFHETQRAVPVVRDAFDDAGHAARTVAFIDDFLHLFPFKLAGTLLDRALDIRVRDVVLPRVLDGGSQSIIDRWISSSASCDLDQARMAREDLAAPRVLGGLTNPDVGPFTVSGHERIRIRARVREDDNAIVASSVCFESQYLRTLTLTLRPSPTFGTPASP